MVIIIIIGFVLLPIIYCKRRRKICLLQHLFFCRFHCLFSFVIRYKINGEVASSESSKNNCELENVFRFAVD